MTEALSEAGSLPAAKQDPQALVLRGRPRRAIRFRRGLIVGLCGGLAAGLVTLSWIALEPPSLRKVVVPLAASDPGGVGGPDALAQLPSSYGTAPRLGPPLPGDLGRPILEQQRELAQTPPAPITPSRHEAMMQAERERARAAMQAARSSPVLVQLGGSAPAAVPVAPPNAATPSAPDPAATAVISGDQQHKIEFARGRSADGPLVEPAPSPWLLTAGTVIPASLLTGLNSDLPGTILAQVTENVRDSATGRTILVPQGARLIGSYDNVVSYGQRRALVVWIRIVFPDGSSIQLDHMPATDTAGFAGLNDRVDSHGWQLLKGIVLSTLLGVGTQISLGSSESELVRAVRESTEQNAAHAGDQLTSRTLEIAPTLTVRPGWPVRVLVNRDLVLKPWSG